MKSKKTKKIFKLIINIIIFAILIYGIFYAYQFYQKNNFNEFVRSESNLYTSTFIRDDKIKYSENRSYKIESLKYNDAMFYKTIKLEKNKPYKISCMVKTNNIEKENEKTGIGAQISIEGTTERSIAISGTNDWQKIELIFNSKNREEVNVGFRLGGYEGKAKGEAWFSNFIMEKGTMQEDTNWKFACFILENTDVTIDGKNVKLNVTNQDKKDIEDTLNRFQRSVSELSQNKMTAQCDIYQIQTPLVTLSYDEKFGYYVSPEDVEQQIATTIKNNDYDHIFVVVRLRR